jgi:hypothetical protein
LDLLQEEGKADKRSSHQRIESAIRKQLAPLATQIKTHEAATVSLKEGFEIQTKNMEKLLDEVTIL